MNVDANEVIARYRKLADELQYNLFVLQAQVDALQKELNNADKSKEGDQSAAE